MVSLNGIAFTENIVHEEAGGQRRRRRIPRIAGFSDAVLLTSPNPTSADSVGSGGVLAVLAALGDCGLELIVVAAWALSTITNFFLFLFFGFAGCPQLYDQLHSFLQLLLSSLLLLHMLPFCSAIRVHLLPESLGKKALRCAWRERVRGF